MGDTSKYDSFLAEIVSLEKMVHNVVGKNQQLLEIKKVSEERINQLQSENQVLVNKIKELERKTNLTEGNIAATLSKKKLDVNERENLKSQIDDLIEKIDYHIHS
jgi:flagellar biosynthesis/type III secretory pathway chaperone